MLINYYISVANKSTIVDFVDANKDNTIIAQQPFSFTTIGLVCSVATERNYGNVTVTLIPK